MPGASGSFGRERKTHGLDRGDSFMSLDMFKYSSNYIYQLCAFYCMLLRVSRSIEGGGLSGSGDQDLLRGDPGLTWTWLLWDLLYYSIFVRD